VLCVAALDLLYFFALVAPPALQVVTFGSVLTSFNCCMLPICLLCFLVPRHGDFVSRYKILLPREQQDMVLASEQQTRAAVVQLLAVFKVPPGQYEMGRSKVFFKPGVMVGRRGFEAAGLRLHSIGYMWVQSHRFAHM
jgi:hypothetical protein